MKKIVKYGWISKKIYDAYSGSLILNEIYELKGHKKDYLENDWPPIKVKITVEEVK